MNNNQFQPGTPSWENGKVDQWREQIKIIRCDLTWINHNHDVMRRIIYDVWNKNPLLLAHPGRTLVLDQWRMYFGFWLAVQLRRDIDKDERSVSLLNLVSDIAQNASILTHAQLRRLWDDPLGLLTRSEFLRFADNTGEHLDPAIPTGHMKRLVEASDSLRLFVNRMLVHRNPEAAADAPSFNEMDSIANVYEEIAKDYILLLTGESYSFRVVEQFEWIDIFDFPWRQRHDVEG